jgi:signal transduction histidine kinase
LVVDDREEARCSVQSLLEREGHAVLTAPGGEEALAILKKTAVHLVLVDCFMEGMSGEELIRSIRTFDQYVQIILVTGYAGSKPPRRMLAELDIQGYHDKADGPEKLLLWVDIALKAHQAIQALQERDRIKRELIANVSHEFRTPLNVIGGYTALLMEGDFGQIPQDAVNPLSSMVNATHSLAELVADFLDYSKLEARAVDVTHQWIDTAELAAELQRMGTLLVEGRAVEFRAELVQAPAVVLTDSVKLRTILRNLVTNAAKFTTTGSITLRIGSAEGVVEFAVADTGPGIRPEDLSVIFEPFRQLNTPSGRGRGGFGLGLALSRKLALILGGTLDVDSREGVGSTFVLRLSAAAVTNREVEMSSSTVIPANGVPGAAPLVHW